MELEQRVSSGSRKKRGILTYNIRSISLVGKLRELKETISQRMGRILLHIFATNSGVF
jgi:hypothetical protein